jgi:hypothetical protein
MSLAATSQPLLNRQCRRFGRPVRQKCISKAMRKIVLLNYTYHLFSATEKTNTFKDMQKWEN